MSSGAVREPVVAFSAGSELDLAHVVRRALVQRDAQLGVRKALVGRDQSHEVRLGVDGPPRGELNAAVGSGRRRDRVVALAEPQAHVGYRIAAAVDEAVLCRRRERRKTRGATVDQGPLVR